MKWIYLALVLAATFPAQALGEERKSLCVKYEKKYGWSNGMQVNAIVSNGQELAQATGNLGRFKPFATYVVIFWEQNEASLIEMHYPTIGALPVRGTDQQGRTWTVADTDVCW